MTERFYKYMFLVAALYNFLFGVLGILVGVLGGVTQVTFALANNAFPVLFVFYYTVMAWIIAFGVGYFLVFRDMYGNRSLIIVAIIAKVSYAIIVLSYFLVLPGELPLQWAITFLVGMIVDLVFAALFGLFLNSASTSAQEKPAGAS